MSKKNELNNSQFCLPHQVAAINRRSLLKTGVYMSGYMAASQLLRMPVAEAQSYTVPAFRRQDTVNRQNSIDDLSQDMKNQLAAMTEQTLNQCEETYQTMLRLGVAKETARRILPLCTKTTLYMNGTLRSWIHYLELRRSKETQLEHREIAEGIKQIFQEQFPVLANVIFN